MKWPTPKYQHGQFVEYCHSHGHNESIRVGEIYAVEVKDYGYDKPLIGYSIRRPGKRRNDHVGERAVRRAIP